MDGEVVVDLKSTGAMNLVFAKQLRTYLVLSGLKIGLVVNFGMALMKDGIVRVINSHNLNDSPTQLCASASLREKEKGFPQRLERHREKDAEEMEVIFCCFSD